MISSLKYKFENSWLKLQWKKWKQLKFLIENRDDDAKDDEDIDIMLLVMMVKRVLGINANLEVVGREIIHNNTKTNQTKSEHTKHVANLLLILQDWKKKKCNSQTQSNCEH